MRDPSLLELADRRQPWNYQVELLRCIQLTDRGILHETSDGTHLLEWCEVLRALAAEVGEPEGVRTVIFDLLVGDSDTPDGRAYSVFRMDADPGECAMNVARALASRLASGVASSSIKSLAIEGTASGRFPNLEDLEASAVEFFSGE